MAPGAHTNRVLPTKRYTMTNFIFLSKGNQDEYINMLAKSAGQEPTDTDFFDYKYDVTMDGMTPVLRGILKYTQPEPCMAMAAVLNCSRKSS